MFTVQSPSHVWYGYLSGYPRSSDLTACCWSYRMSSSHRQECSITPISLHPSTETSIMWSDFSTFVSEVLIYMPLILDSCWITLNNLLFFDTPYIFNILNTHSNYMWIYQNFSQILLCKTFMMVLIDGQFYLTFGFGLH